MKYSDFIKKYNNKKVDRWDTSNLNQCTDLFLAYLDEVLGLASIIPIGIVNAYDIYNKTHKFTPHSTKIKNDPNAIPQYGDVIIWGSGYGPAGHVAIFTEGDVNKFKAFSQNDPIGSSCVIKEYTYRNVLGWLRPNNMPKEQSDLDACLIAHSQCMSKVGEQEQMIKNLQGELSSCNALKNQEVTKNSNLQVEIKMFKDDIHKKEQEKHEIEKNYLIKIKELQEQIKELERDTRIKLDEISKANESLTICRQEIASATVSDKKLPYKKLYNEAMDKISEIEQNMNKTHVKLARNKTIRYLQQLLYKLDVHV